MRTDLAFIPLAELADLYLWPPVGRSKIYNDEGAGRIHARCRGMPSNAESMISAANACAKLGSYHLAFHLATMAMEEIRKSSMIFLDALDRKPPLPGDENGSPLKWVEDHERKLFWAIWLPARENLRDWHTI